MKSTVEYLTLLRDYMTKNATKYGITIKEELQNLFGCGVDIVRMRERMDILLKNRIEKEVIYV